MIPLTSRIPIINPNTPKSRFAWLFIAARPMNSIIAAVDEAGDGEVERGLRRQDQAWRNRAGG